MISCRKMFCNVSFTWMIACVLLFSQSTKADNVTSLVIRKVSTTLDYDAHSVVFRWEKPKFPPLYYEVSTLWRAIHSDKTVGGLTFTLSGDRDTFTVYPQEPIQQYATLTLKAIYNNEGRDPGITYVTEIKARETKTYPSHSNPIHEQSYSLYTSLTVNLEWENLVLSPCTNCKETSEYLVYYNYHFLRGREKNAVVYTSDIEKCTFSKFILPLRSKEHATEMAISVSINDNDFLEIALPVSEGSKPPVRNLLFREMATSIMLCWESNSPSGYSDSFFELWYKFDSPDLPVVKKTTTKVFCYEVKNVPPSTFVIIALREVTAGVPSPWTLAVHSNTHSSELNVKGLYEGPKPVKPIPSQWGDLDKVPVFTPRWGASKSSDQTEEPHGPKKSVRPKPFSSTWSRFSGIPVFLLRTFTPKYVDTTPLPPMAEWKAVESDQKKRDHGPPSQQRSGPKFYSALEQFLLTKEQLRDNCYPLEVPFQPGKAIIRGKPPPRCSVIGRAGTAAWYHQCHRCKNPFAITETGKYVRNETCTHHYGKMYRSKSFGNPFIYTCCQKERGSEGCEVARCHITFGKFNPVQTGFVSTLPHPPQSNYVPKVYALDCEMCYTAFGCELTRVTVIDHNMNAVYESYVQPPNPIVDYCTRFSGITASDLQGVTTTLQDVQNDLQNIIFKDSILIGHGLNSDLRFLKIIHENVVDTSIVFPHECGLPFRRALKDLTLEYLGRTIQNRKEEGHDSNEDATASMDLMKWKVAQSEPSRREN